jgi:hypothetical protein
MEPLPDRSAVSPYCSFTSVDYMEPSTNTNQKRTLALIRTSEKTGYYVDIFQSDAKGKNEYLYHNLGNSVKLLDAENNPISVCATNELSEHVDGYGPGYKLFKNKQTTTDYKNNVLAQFRLKVENKEDIFMDMHIPGGEDREYFTAMAPKSYTAPSEYKLLPNPVALIRQKGEAWSNPFLVVYESYSGENKNAINKVTSNSENGISVVNVKGKFGKQTIIQSITKETWKKGQDYFEGHFGIISTEIDNTISYLYLGHGKKIGSGDYEIKSKNKQNINANIEILEEKIVVSSNQPAILLLPVQTDGKMMMEIQGEKKELTANKMKDGRWRIEIPAVLNATILM